MELQEKILKYYEGKVVRKDLTSLVKGNAVVPTYVLEYLLGQYCAVNDEEIIQSGVEKVKQIISDNYVHRSDAEVIKSRIREKGHFKIIDKINVQLNDRANQYEAEFANLGIKKVPISDKIVKENQKLLSGGGVWSIINMGYTHAADVEVRWEIEELKPIQISHVSLEEFIEARKNFTVEEWLDVLLYTIGLNPESFTRRGKLIQISRLLTHVENNYNFVELGPKGTGKSHIFSELSPHGVLVSGGDVSKARLFVNNNGDKIGLVGYWDVVALDEFEQEVGGKKTDGDLVKIMQNYMANQSFNRGKETYQATASMAFVGNTKHTVPFMLKHSHLFESIPAGYIKGAFLDRMHFYSPGWEVKILKEAVFSEGYGFIVDYLAEILRQLRKADYTGLMDQYFELDGSLTARDKIAIRKSFSGFMKLLYPHKELTLEQAKEILDFSIEGRKRVKDQLYIIDETFRDHPAEFKYTIVSSGKTEEVETLEKVNLQTDLLNQQEDAEQHESPKVEPSAEVAKLEPKHIVIRDNQTGISYRRLFGDYLKGAKTITLTDPYIRLPYQFKNLMEFCIMLAQNKLPEEEAQLHVITWNTKEYMPESELNFQELVSSVADMGITLTYEYQDLHDRHIISDTGWRIQLGRGLDIFEPRDGRFNPAEYYQERRNCKNCEIIIMKK
ncbi:MAG: BREX system Lon protease-like protein BrxL [Chitinophagaceae bacterium]|nr:BREX system Lon protease-like protein BrxL [Chitinophagaceae bacterium]